MNWRLLLLRAVSAYLRHAPDHPGRWRLIAPAVRLAPALKSVSAPMIVRGRDGFRLEVDGSSQTGRMLYATGEYESETSRLVRQLLKPGDTMIDVGANIGFFTVLAARTVGPTGRVVSFEPVDNVRARLQRNIALNGLTNVTVRTEALSDRSGSTSFFTGPPNDTGLGSLRPVADSHRIDVTQARFDDLWDAAAPIALIKIDVEGAEAAAIRGMSASLARHSPDVILEVTDDYLRTVGESAASLLEQLTSLGYSAYRIALDRLVPIEAAADLASCPPQFNALFTKRRHDEITQR